MLRTARLADALATAAVARRMTRRGDSAGSRAARLLSARQVLQLTVLGARPSAPALRAGAGVDGLHAASMVALAVWRPARRREALTSAASAGALLVGGRRCAASIEAGGSR